MPTDSYGPIQLAKQLSFAGWQMRRARDLNLIPPPGDDRRWPAVVVEQLAADRDSIAAALGTIADVGAIKAAEHLTARLGVDVEPGAVAELADAGRIPVVGEYEGWPLYSGLAIEAFTDVDAVVAANAAGRLLNSEMTAAFLKVRVVDVRHLVRAGRLTPRKLVESQHQPRSWGRTVPLYRSGDLAALLDDDTLNWAAAQAARRGERSPFADLPNP